MRIGNLWNGRCIKGKHEEKWVFFLLKIFHKKNLSNRRGLRHHKLKDGLPAVSELKEKCQGPFRVLRMATPHKKVYLFMLKSVFCSKRIKFVVDGNTALRVIKSP